MISLLVNILSIGGPQYILNLYYQRSNIAITQYIMMKQKLALSMAMTMALAVLILTLTAVPQLNIANADNKKLSCTDCTIKIKGGNNEITIQATPGAKGDKGDTGSPGRDGINGTSIVGPPGNDGINGKDGTTLSNETVSAVNSLVSNEGVFQTILDLFNNGSLSTSITVENGTLVEEPPVPPVNNTNSTG